MPEPGVQNKKETHGSIQQRHGDFQSTGQVQLLDVIGHDTPICRCKEIIRAEVQMAGRDVADIMDSAAT